MLWFILALLSAILVATHQMLVKKYVKNINEFVLSSGNIFIAAVILLVVSAIHGFPEINSRFYTAVTITASFNVIATVLIYKALKKTELSLAMPMLAFTPAFLIGTSFLILGEQPTAAGIIGIVCIVVGSYVLTMAPHQKMLDPLKRLFREKGMLAVLVVACIYSITANFDKKVVTSSDVYFGTAMSYFIISGALFIFAYTSNRPIVEYKKNKYVLLLLGTILALAGVAANTALTLQIVPYVIAIKRLSTLFVVVYGIFLFREQQARQRFVGALIMVAGALVILLF